MGSDSINDKREEKLKKMGRSWKEFAKAILILFITVTICCYLALNLIFIGYVPAEVIFPTNACLPPYMSRIPPQCDESVDVNYRNDSIKTEQERSMYKRCKPSAFRRMWDEGLPPDIVKLLENVQQTSKKKQAWEYTSAPAFNKQYWQDKSWSNIPGKFVRLILKVMMIKTFINVRKQHHTFHSLFKNLDGRLNFFIIFVILLILMSTGTFMLLLGSIVSIWQIMIILNYILVVITDHTLQIFNPFWWLQMPLSIIWINLWFMRDFFYNYLALFIFNGKVRTICSCKMAEYWPIVSVVFVFFALTKASNYLDPVTVVGMWVVFIIFIIINRKKITGSSGSSASSNCDGTKIFKKS